MKWYREVVGPEAPREAFRFDADGQATTWAMWDAYCDDPRCIAPEAAVHLVNVADPQRRISFEIDVMDGQITGDALLRDVDRPIAREFVGDKGVRRVLMRHRALVRGWALTQWREGPPVPLEERCYGFGDFDAYGDDLPIPFESDGVEWYAADAHCINPACNCEDVILSFVDEEGFDEPESGEAFSVRVDLCDGSAEDADIGKPLPAARSRVLADFQGEVCTWREDLHVRRKLIREIALLRVRRLAPLLSTPFVAPASPAARRNEPCPCGSGRKFKKCCGAPGR